MLVAELQPYGGDKLDTISLRGEPIKLKPQHAISLGMVFHELAANAAKYGALSSRTGRVAVSWTVAETGGGRQLVLEWREQGGPAVVPPTRTGFGSRLIEQTARGAGGKVEFEFAPDGLRCAITDAAELNRAPSAAGFPPPLAGEGVGVGAFQALPMRRLRAAVCRFHTP